MMSQNYTPEYRKKIVRLHEEEGSVMVKHICNGGMGKARFLRQAVICPAAFLHKLLYAFLRIHAITCLSVSILIPKRVLK